MLAPTLSLALLTPAAPATDPPPAPVPVWEVEPAPREPTPGDRVLRQRALGLGIAGGFSGVVWLGMRWMILRSDLDVARELEADPKSMFCIESCYIGTLLNGSLSPLLITGAGLAGGALHAHGRWLARRGVGLGRSPRAARAMIGAGVGLLAGAIVGLGVGLGTQRYTTSERGRVGLRELAWSSATVLGTAGASLTGFGHGILRGHAERRDRVEVSWSPMVGREQGIAVVGRF